MRSAARLPGADGVRARQGRGRHGGGGQSGERWFTLCRIVVDQHRLAPALDDAAFFEKREHTHADGLQQLGDVRIGERGQSVELELVAGATVFGDVDYILSPIPLT